MKNILWFVFPIMLFIGCKKDKSTDPDLTKDYPELIKGEWDYEKNLINYTSFQTEGDAIFDMNLQELGIRLLISSDLINVYQDGETTPNNVLEYSIIGNKINLRDVNEVETNQGEILKLNEHVMQWAHNIGHGDTLYDGDDAIGIINNMEMHFKRHE